MRFRSLIPMKLQFFAEADGAGGGDNGGNQSNNAPDQGGQQSNNAPEIDYDRIQQMLNGTLAAKENSALKSYFKQMGLSQEDAEKAMNDFKAQKAANTPDIAGLQNQVTQAQAQAQQARIEAAATIAAVNLGIDSKRIPYLLQMADLTKAVGEDGKISEEAVSEAINTVLEAIPEFKPQATEKSGFTQIGTGGNPAQHPQNSNAGKSVATKRWNRFN